MRFINRRWGLSISKLDLTHCAQGIDIRGTSSAPWHRNCYSAWLCTVPHVLVWNPSSTFRFGFKTRVHVFLRHQIFKYIINYSQLRFHFKLDSSVFGLRTSDPCRKTPAGCGALLPSAAWKSCVIMPLLTTHRLSYRCKCTHTHAHTHTHTYEILYR